MNRLDSLLSRFTSKQIAIVGGAVVSLLLIMSVITFAAVGWSYSVDLAAKREEERVAKEKEKAVADLQKAFSGIFKAPSQKKIKNIDWLTHDKDAVLGDAKITITGGDFGVIKYAYQSGRNATFGFTQKKTANIRVRISNTSTTKIIEYVPWHSLDHFGSPQVKDEHGNRCDSWRSYSQLTSGHGVSPYCKINPGESVDDTFAFTYPLPISSEFFISLSGYAVGFHSVLDDSAVHFKIPRSFFVEAK